MVEKYNMRYLKLFESYNNIKFYRFSKSDILEGELEGIFQPKSRVTWGHSKFNEYLISLGLPDREKCIHFMDELAFNSDSLEKFKDLYGNWIYEVEVDNNSKLGWSFCVPINDWYFPKWRELKDNKLVQDIMKFNSKLGRRSTDNFIEHQNYRKDKMFEYLLDRGVIGSGTLDDIKNLPHFGKYPVFVWTTDDIRLKKIKII